MTGHYGLELSPVRRRVWADRLEELSPAVAREIVQELPARVPGYRVLPREQVLGDVLPMVELNLARAATVLREGPPPGGVDLEPIHESAARRAEEGVTVDTVIDGYHVGFEIALRRLTAMAGPEEHHELAGVVHGVLDQLRRVVIAVSTGYLEARQALSGEALSARQGLLVALLEGGGVENAARLAGVALPAHYVILALTTAPHPDAATPGVQARIVERRTVRRALGEIGRSADSALAALRADGGRVLLPGSDDDLAAARRLQADIARVTGVAVTAAMTVATPHEVPAGVALAEEILDVVACSARPAGLYRLDDVLVDYQLARPGPARTALAARLAPLDDRPELEETLHRHLLTGTSRQRTAAQLRIHANSVDHRLRRVAELTGLGLAGPVPLAQARAAVLARRAAGHGPAIDPWAGS